ncbi:MAG: hypothetical protein DMF03_03310, partial [Verrucomicrobia bacterium]
MRAHFGIETQALGIKAAAQPNCGMKQLNIGIIGVGWPGQQHAKAIAALPNIRLHSCADNDPGRLDAFVKEHQPGVVFTDYHALLDDPDLEAAIICLPNFLHFPA